MDAIVTAGGIPNPEDPLYSFLKGDAKALVDVAGKPMIQWVLDALSDAKHVENVIVIGLSPKVGLTCKKPLHFVSNQGRMLSNIVVGVNKALELNRRSEYVLIVSSDIPTLKPEMVDWLVETCMQSQDDLYYGICPREVMEKFVLILSPFAPHIAEELWQLLGHEKTIAYEPWPQFNDALTKDAEVEIPVQILGKLRGKVVVPAGSVGFRLSILSRISSLTLVVLYPNPPDLLRSLYRVVEPPVDPVAVAGWSQELPDEAAAAPKALSWSSSGRTLMPSMTGILSSETFPMRFPSTG